MVRRGLLVTLISALLVLFGGAVAAAACVSPTGNSGGGDAATPVTSALPESFPADLRQFVAGTDEFRAGPWFSGPCASKGGDLGVFITAAFGQEDRLLWWSDPENRGTSEPAHDELARVFPYDDPTFKMPSACADDLKSWATPASSNPWGFTWVSAPDRASVDAMIAAASEHAAVPGQAWSTPCKMDDDSGMYCAHAFFVDCEKANSGFSAASQCQGWNQSVGRLYGGTANWIEQNTTFTDRLTGVVDRVPAFQAGKWVLDMEIQGLQKIGSVASSAVQFVSDPSSVAGTWANDFKNGAVDMSTRTLMSITCSHHFDPTAPWFLSMYAASMAFGFVVMAFMAVFTVTRSGYRGSPKELTESLFQYLPLGLFLSMFVPGLAALILAVTTAAADSTAKLLGQSTGKVIANITALGDATSDNFFGGTIGGLILFAGLALAALLLWLGMQIHQYGMPLSLVVVAFSLGMMVSPKYRKKALGPIFVFLGLALSVPLLFLLLAVVFATVDSVWGSQGDTAVGMASQVLFVALGMMLVALAPWALLKWAPVLPTKADSEDFGGTGPGVGEGVVGAASSYMMYRGGGGSGGGGVGSEQPAARQDTTAPIPATPLGSGGQSGQQGPMQTAYQQRSDLAGAGTSGGPSGSAGAGEVAGAGRAGAGAATKGAAEAGGTAAAGATGGIAAGVAVAAQAASAAITKAKATADTAAPEADN